MKDEPNKAPDLAESTALGIGWAGVVAALIQVLLRKPCTAGYRTFGLPAFLCCAIVPYLAIEANKAPLRGMVPSPAEELETIARWVVMGFWFMQWAGAQKNRNREHSYYTGETIFMGRYSRGSEAVMGVGISLFFALWSPGLGVAFGLSTLCSAIFSGASEMRRSLSAQAILDASLEGRQTAEDFRNR